MKLNEVVLGKTYSYTGGEIPYNVRAIGVATYDTSFYGQASPEALEQVLILSLEEDFTEFSSPDWVYASAIEAI